MSMILWELPHQEPAQRAYCLETSQEALNEEAVPHPFAPTTGPVRRHQAALPPVSSLPNR